jgi:hypothetical protein
MSIKPGMSFTRCFQSIGFHLVQSCSGFGPAAVDQQYSGKASGICSSGRKRSPTDPGAYSRSEMILTPFFHVK